MGNIPHSLIALLTAAAIVMLGSACESKTRFGLPVEGEVVDIDYALTQPAVGRTVVLEGALHGVCQDEGCYFTLSDRAHEILVRYTGENGLGIPVVARGKARVRGKIRDTIIGRNRVSEVRATGVELLGE
ncbi:MAG: hypothetical protein FGM32_03545 [Candidatus Kapabacteria bacterium]|nr:hypothetical protein [Candidatus Kapabacteria bacterium]